MSLGEIGPEDWGVYDRTGLPPKRNQSAVELRQELRAAGWPVEEADPAAGASREAEAERLEAMSGDDHLADIQEGRWQPRER